jgi:hypothetical protein
MEFRGDHRAVTVQVGAVILLGFVVISLSIYQTTVVPLENERVEFQHSQTVQNQLVDLRNGILRTAGTASAQPTTVDLGTRYPSRAVFVNPPPAVGTVRTVNTTDPAVNVTLTSVESPDDEVGDYWNGSTVTYNTGGLAYDPGYNVYDGAPRTVYGNTLLYSSFEDGSRVRLRTGQALVDGRQIHLVLVNGSLGESGVDATSVRPRPLSVSSTEVTLRNEAGTPPMNVTIPTALSASDWRTALAGETQVNVTAVPGRDAVNVTLQNDTTYELKVSRIGVGRVDDRGDGPRYLTLADGPESGLTNDTTVEYTVEVRDRFNNPASGVQVTATSGSNVSVTPTTAVSDASGRATFAVTPQCPADAGCTASFNFSIDGGNQAYQVVDGSDGAGPTRITPRAGAGAGGGASDINPAETGDITLVSSNRLQSDNSVAELRLNNTDTATSANISSARINFYLETQQGGGGGGNSDKRFTQAVLEDSSGKNRSDAPLNISGPFVGIDDVNVPAGTDQRTRVRIDFDSNGKIEPGEFFVITLRFDTGEVDTYFVAPKK